MPLVETLPVGAGTAQWPVWGTTARIVLTEPAMVPAAEQLVRAELAAVDAAASRFRPDSELSQVNRAAGRPVPVSALLAELVDTALAAARRTGGAVDPTVGAGLVALGYDRDFAEVAVPGPERPWWTVTAPGWRAVELTGRRLRVPAGTVLDLGATAKAWTADRCAATVAADLGTGVLVSLGGDLASAGPAPDGGWRVLVADGPGQPRCQVALPAGAALATSSTLSRSWQAGARRLHHILDPASGWPAEPVWRTVSVAAGSCLLANTLSTAAIVRGDRALGWLRGIGAPARLVDRAGRCHLSGGWPATEPGDAG